MRTIICLFIAVATLPSIGQQVVAPGIICTEAREFAPTFIHEDLLCFTRAGSPNTILFSTRVDGQWETPTIAPFSGTYADENPNYDPKSGVLIFSSKRPTPKDSALTANDLWFVRKTDAGWTEPTHLDGGFSCDGIDGSGILSGDLVYFHSDRGGKGIADVDLYSLSFNSPQGEATKLDINSDLVDGEPFFFLDGKAMLFMSAGFGSAGASDLFLSQYENGRWQEPVSLDATGQVNTEKWEYTPRLSPDLKTLYFTRFEDTGPTIMSIDVHEMQSEVLKNMISGK